MTIVKGIESDEVKHRTDEIKSAILLNDPIEDKLNVVMVISNPCEYQKRWELAKAFISHMEDNDHVNLYIAEMAYEGQTFHVTDSDNPMHLQMRTQIPLWCKESLIDAAINQLLPSDWKAVAWIDADVEFGHPEWARDTLKVLNGSKDVVQLFSHCLDMDKNENTMNVFTSFGYQYATGKKYCGRGCNFWHPGFGWAMTRKAYIRLGFIFYWSILGAADHQMAFAFIGKSSSIHANSSDGYKKKIVELVKKSRNLRLGYVPGVIRHFWHGSKQNRKYMERWQILIKYNYDPFIHVKLNEEGIIVPTDECPKDMLCDIMKYFQERREDD